ncbi:MAG TPA: hypothetical protein DHW70_04495 [Candidatus Atribacteria bacterium]|nr:hypothetical protein [Candidatus Atribacteria bacterium]
MQFSYRCQPQKSKRIFFYSYNWCYPASSSGCHKEDFEAKGLELLPPNLPPKMRAYPKEIKRIAPEIKVFSNFCPEFVSIVEAGKFTAPKTYEVAREYLKPLKDAQIDTLILGCTHYSFLKKVISDIMGPEVILIDPAVSTSLTLKEVIIQKGILKEEGKGEENYYTTGSPKKVEKTAKIILHNDNFKIKKVNLKELE